MHLVSFNVPFPPNQGGVIDVYAKLKALHLEGIKVIFHTYLYDRPEAKELELYCDKVYYYPRSRNLFDVLNALPFIVFSRKNPLLYERLMADPYPIILEGLHTCYWLNKKGFDHKTVWVRTHNIEHDYYAGLAKAESHIFKKIFFALEAIKLRYFEKVLSKAQGVFCIAEGEILHYQKYHNRVELLSAFHMNDKVLSKVGKGNYALYHGSLDIAENEKAAIWLIEQVFSYIDQSLIIAGNNASDRLRKLCELYPNIELKEGVSTSELSSLISEAQLHVLPTFQNTGIKLKLLHALYKGRFCIVNNEMVLGSGLESYCVVANDSIEFRAYVNEYMQKEFTEKDLEHRLRLNESMFSNQVNVQKIISELRLQ